MSTSRASKHTWITKPFKQSVWLKTELFHAFQWLVRPTKSELRPNFFTHSSVPKYIRTSLCHLLRLLLGKWGCLPALLHYLEPVYRDCISD